MIDNVNQNSNSGIFVINIFDFNLKGDVRRYIESKNM